MKRRWPLSCSIWALSFLFSLASFAVDIEGEVTVYKYWHLGQDIDTTNILNAKKLQQYQNQRQVYVQVDRLLAQGKHPLIIAEGCEGEIDHNFTKSFNGWNYLELKARLKNPNYADILTLVPLKLEVKYQDKIRTVCGDQGELIAETAGTFDRLGEELKALSAAKGEKNKAEMKKHIEASLKLIDQIKALIGKRNQAFLKVILAHLKEDPLVILGGGHLEGVTDLMYAQKKIAFKVVETPGYPQEDEHHLERLRQELKAQLP